jgi:predicted acylesterase/phospholipase RssA
VDLNLAPITLTNLPATITQGEAINVVFEGGGAKGFSHVAMLYALKTPLEHPGYRIRAAAGASIGAVVAALVAAGAEPEDLVDEATGESPLRNALGLKRFFHLFEPSGWRRLQIIRRLNEKPIAAIFILFIWIVVLSLIVYRGAQLSYISPLLTWMHLITAVAFGVAIFYVWTAISHIRYLSVEVDPFTWRREWAFFAAISSGAILFITAHTVLHYGRHTQYEKLITALPGAHDSNIWLERISFFAFVLVFCSALLGYFRRLLKGIVRTDPIKNYVDDALALLLAKDAATGAIDDTKRQKLRGDRVRFKNLRIPLRVVAADIILNRQELFTTERNPEMPVADAVVASLAIPFLLKPSRILGSLYVDGGIVSNIPAWVFRPERAIDPDAKILAVGIGAGKADSWIPALLENIDRKGAGQSQSRAEGEIVRAYLGADPKPIWAQAVWFALRIFGHFELRRMSYTRGFLGVEN